MDSVNMNACVACTVAMPHPHIFCAAEARILISSIELIVFMKQIKETTELPKTTVDNVNLKVLTQVHQTFQISDVSDADASEISDF